MRMLHGNCQDAALLYREMSGYKKEIIVQVLNS